MKVRKYVVVNYRGNVSDLAVHSFESKKDALDFRNTVKSRSGRTTALRAHWFEVPESERVRRIPIRDQ